MDLIWTVGLSFGAGALLSIGGWLDNFIKQNDKKDFDLKKFLVTAIITGIVGGLIAVPSTAYEGFISPELVAAFTGLLMASVGKPIGTTISKTE